MKIENKTLICKSAPEYFDLEKTSKKANTVRIEKIEEVQEIRSLFYGNALTTIRIVHTDTGEYFEREISDIARIGGAVGYSMIVISWKPEAIQKTGGEG